MLSVLKFQLQASLYTLVYKICKRRLSYFYKITHSKRELQKPLIVDSKNAPNLDNPITNKSVDPIALFYLDTLYIFFIT